MNICMKKKTQKNKSIKLNYIYNVSYQILTLITPLITAPYLSRVLKADGIVHTAIPTHWYHTLSCLPHWAL
mgnify:CR=1 FL=1